MITMSLSEAARCTGGSVVGEDVEFSGCTTDSREVAAGALFIALSGERFDGHEFSAAAMQDGASAAMVERVVDECPAMLIVSNTRHAMGSLAHAWRTRFDVPLIAVTGSNGKTTVKEMIASVLAGEAPVLATRGTLHALGSSLGDTPTQPLYVGRPNAIGHFTIEACTTPHDAAEPIAVRVSHTEGPHRYGIAQDIGHLTPELQAFLGDCGHKPMIIEL